MSMNIRRQFGFVGEINLSAAHFIDPYEAIDSEGMVAYISHCLDLLPQRAARIAVANRRRMARCRSTATLLVSHRALFEDRDKAVQRMCREVGIVIGAYSADVPEPYGHGVMIGPRVGFGPSGGFVSQGVHVSSNPIPPDFSRCIDSGSVAPLERVV